MQRQAPTAQAMVNRASFMQIRGLAGDGMKYKSPRQRVVAVESASAHKNFEASVRNEFTSQDSFVGI